MNMNRKKDPSIMVRTMLRWSMATLALAPLGLLAQRTVNASGGNAIIGGNTYSYSIGEMTVVSTATAGSFTTTQGVLQAGMDGTIGVQELSGTSEGILLYPNPVADLLYLQPALQGGGNLHLRLYDASGKLLMDREAQLGAGNEPQQISMVGMAEGAYFLNAVLRNGKQEFRKTYKVLKSVAGQ